MAVVPWAARRTTGVPWAAPRGGLRTAPAPPALPRAPTEASQGSPEVDVLSCSQGQDPVFPEGRRLPGVPPQGRPPSMSPVPTRRARLRPRPPARGRPQGPTPGAGCGALRGGGTQSGGRAPASGRCKAQCGGRRRRAGRHPRGGARQSVLRRQGAVYASRSGACSARKLRGQGPRGSAGHEEVPGRARRARGRPGGAHGRRDAQSRRAGAAEGTVVVSGSSGLGRHVDVPEGDGAAGGLVPE